MAQKHQEYFTLYASGELRGRPVHLKVARNFQEAKSLIEAGFDYVTDMDGVKLFRKWKQLSLLMGPQDFWWGRGDLNPGPRTPQARILDQARPRPQQPGLRPSVKGNIVKTLFKLKNLGKAEGTIKATANRLKHLARYCDLDDPESSNNLFLVKIKIIEVLRKHLIPNAE